MYDIYVFIEIYLCFGLDYLVLLVPNYSTEIELFLKYGYI